MILGIGIDNVEVERFAHWHTYAPSTLRRIFSQEEIDYCLSNLTKSAERFAVRFAAREAFFKALSSAYPESKIPFLTICKLVCVHKINNESPILEIDWQRFIGANSDIKSFISITHTKSVASAFVILEINF